ncbi:acetylornithine deacetylase [Aminobacter sp. P9b]|uniref:acetylornithine deacetylase n=1 Tax=Aminobacter sp. P9b TaxID=3133697 RepID=UPI00325143A8
MNGSSAVGLESTLNVIERFISFNTESSRSNLELVDWVEGSVKGPRVSCFRTFNAEKSKATLCITVGPPVDGGVVLSGHIDVVPVEGQAWSSDPYSLRQADGRLYGRGTCDMKAFGAIAVAHIPYFLASNIAKPVHIVLSYDEEVTSRGSIAVIEEFGRSLPKPSSVIVGEPTMMKVADTHKSISTYYTTVTGHEAHSSKPNIGANAIMGACELVDELYRFAARLEKETDPSGGLEPAYSTINVGTISGGTARNILARECKFHWEFRGLPGIPQDLAVRHLERYASAKVLPRLRRYTDDATISTIVGTEVPGLVREPGSMAETLALKLSESNETVAMPFATEAGQFQVRGYPTVLCGPGNVDQAHQPDEYIAVDQVESCMRFMRRLGEYLKG